jgi:AcrR family transcriptional regulator
MQSNPEVRVKNSSTMQQIILAAIHIINTRGAEAVTTRRIAETAGVNTAAMNYYFGSKESLIQHVTQLTLSHVFSDWEMILAEPGMDTPAKIYFLLDYTIEGITRYPGLTNSYLFDQSLNAPTKREFIEKFDSLSNKLTSLLQPLLPLMSTEDIRYSIGQLMLTVISAALIPEMFTIVAKGEIVSPEARCGFILRLMKGMLGIELCLTDKVQEHISLLREKAFSSESV